MSGRFLAAAMAAAVLTAAGCGDGRSAEPAATANALPSAPRLALGQSEGFWDRRPLDAPVVERRAPAGIGGGPGAPPEPAAGPDEGADYFSDSCADYLFDQAMHLRCQWLTGPDRGEAIPPAGWDQPLAVQMRCHPLREDPVGYNACLARQG